MNILVVEKTYPWPLASGSHIRVASIVEALATLGEVDFFHITKEEPEPAPQSHDAVARFAAMQLPPSGYRGFRRRATWLTASRLPLEVAVRDYSALRSAFRRWARPRYDLAWIGRADNYFAVGELITAPTVLDMDDLKDHWIAGSLRLNGDGHGLLAGGSPSGNLLHTWAWRIQWDVNVRRWRALQRRIASSATAVSVCSDVDQERIGTDNTVVIPNGYPAPDRPVGRSEVGEPPTIVLPALFCYRPNVDAAQFLVKDVWPRIRAHSPQARLRLVGDYDDRIADLAAVEGVTLTGFVPDIAAELAAADVIVVPVRFGSGTRVKILEAFAHRIPVVSTTLGSEGLDVEDGKHLLIADDPEGIATACAAALDDAALRGRLVAAAHDLYWSKYRWEVIASEVADVASRLARGSAVGGSTFPESRTPGGATG